MNTGKLVRGLSLQALTATLVVGCGGGGYGDDDDNPPNNPPAAVVRDAQFVDDTVDGLGFSVANVGEGRTGTTGKFQFAEGRRIDFFLGGTTNRLVLGSATPDHAATGTITFSLNDLTEVKAANGDVYLGNLLRLLVLLDANND